jgi:hypothetical protein
MKKLIPTCVLFSVASLALASPASAAIVWGSVPDSTPAFYDPAIDAFCAPTATSDVVCERANHIDFGASVDGHRYPTLAQTWVTAAAAGAR